MWRRRIVVVGAGQLAAVFEEGQPPTYHGGARLGDTVAAVVRRRGGVAGGLPGEAALADLVARGFRLTGRRGPSPAA